MKIGVDIDGVILNFERELKTYAELYNYLELKNGGVKNRHEHYVRNRYGWTDEERMPFAEKYFVKLSEQTAFMPGAVDVLKMLKANGHELIIISARGGMFPEMKDVAMKRLNESGVEFNEYYWHQEDKLETAKQAGVDFMIDDYAETCKKLSENGIKALYFRDVNMPKLEESKYLLEVNNWGEVYRIITESAKKQ